MLRKTLQHICLRANHQVANRKLSIINNTKFVPWKSRPLIYHALAYTTSSKPERSETSTEEQEKLKEMTKKMEKEKKSAKEKLKEAEKDTQDTNAKTSETGSSGEDTKEKKEKKETGHEKFYDPKEEYRKKFTVNKELISKTFFDDLKNKNKETFLTSIDYFIQRDKYLRGHVEFIEAALKRMKEFGVHKDLEAYKKLLDVFPKGTMVARNIWHVEFIHYPKQQNCATDVLEQMEDNGVMGDSEVEDMLAHIFGPTSWPSRKLFRMMYWMPKFKNLSPWLLPDPMPDDSLELFKLAIQRITSVDPASKITIYNSEDLDDANDPTWIVSGQSPDQQSLIEAHNADRPIYVEGAFRIWLRSQCINYFILRAEPKFYPKNERDEDDVGDLKNVYAAEDAAVIPVPTVHEQDDGTILAVCCTGTSSRDSLASWIRFLQETNPRLGKDISVVFTLKSPVGPTDNIDGVVLSAEEQEKITASDRDKGYFGGTIGYTETELSKLGINRFSDTKFINWPHHFNRQPESASESHEKLRDPKKTPQFDSNNNTNKKLS